MFVQDDVIMEKPLTMVRFQHQVQVKVMVKERRRRKW